MTLDYRFPAIEDLRTHARRRIPHYMWEYFDSATGDEGAWHRATAAMDAVTLMPAALAGGAPAELKTEFLGRSYDAPFGIGPLGMSGAVWPDGEPTLARVGAAANIPYSMSTVSAVTPEEIAPFLGETGWFQLYAPASDEMRRDILKRVKDAGFHTLVFTVDVPELSWREREKRVALRNPMPITPRILWQTALCPTYALGMLGRPIPYPRLFEKYVDGSAKRDGAEKHVGLTLRTAPDWDYWLRLREEWDGPLIVKGVMEPDVATRLKADGADAVWVSNHGGRQFSAAPAPIDALPLVREAVGPDFPLVYDGSVRSGTDVLRAIAMGADFVMAARAFHYGLGAAGEAGAAHVVRLLSEIMRLDMGQMGITRPVQARTRLAR